MKLPQRENICEVCDDDPSEYYYRPVVGPLLTGRLKIVLRLLGQGRFENLLEIGFGGGMLLPELASRCKKLFGIDVHDNIPQVEKMCQQEGIKAELRQADISALPFPESKFDAVVCVSVLEHLTEDILTRAIGEIRRVANEDARIVLLFPIKNRITDFLFLRMSDLDLEHHPSDHKIIMNKIRKNFQIEKKIGITNLYLLPNKYKLFLACSCAKNVT